MEMQVVQRMFVTANDLVPEYYQGVLIQIRDSIRDSYFMVGDIANDLINEARLAGFRATQQDVFDAVGKFCGKSGRTVRYYTETARFFPREVRQEYETLPFSHFVLARSMEGRWREVLELATGNPLISEEALRGLFLGERQVGVESLEDAQGQDIIAVGATTPVYGREITIPEKNSYAILSRISALLESSRYLRENLLLGLKESARPSAEQALKRIEQATEELLDLVDRP